jgi:hypothetical protein
MTQAEHNALHARLKASAAGVHITVLPSKNNPFFPQAVVPSAARKRI